MYNICISQENRVAWVSNKLWYMSLWIKSRYIQFISRSFHTYWLLIPFHSSFPCLKIPQVKKKKKKKKKCMAASILEKQFDQRHMFFLGITPNKLNQPQKYGTLVLMLGVLYTLNVLKSSLSRYNSRPTCEVRPISTVTWYSLWTDSSLNANRNSYKADTSLNIHTCTFSDRY